MTKPVAMPKQTNLNLLVDAIAFLGFILAAISGTSFLLIPANDTLSGLHAFGSLMTIAAIVIHIVLHWQWVKTMTRRSVALLSRNVKLPKSARLNVVIDAMITISFLLTAVSGILLNQRSESSESSNKQSVGVLQDSLFDNFPGNPPGHLSDGQMPGSAAKPAFRWEALDSIHLWAVIALLGLSSIHIWMHWRWIINVTGRLVELLGQRPGLSGQPVEMEPQ